jgi:acetyl-CoA synthetase
MREEADEPAGDRAAGRWDDLRARFRWRIPPGFTIARACCDVWAEAEPDRVAIVHLGRGACGAGPTGS